MYISTLFNYTVLTFIYTAKSLTQECEKGFFLYECIVKRTFEQRKNHEKYGKQETEENAETTQAE